tara:strand:- start:326 stop:1630 length:1305 start_codon:yes stop_codon:yes gene_type:complete
MHPSIDNHNIFNSPSVFDYEAIVVDIGGIAKTIQNAISSEENYLTHSDRQVVNGETLDEVTGIKDILYQRQDEFTRALENGAVIVTFIDTPIQITGVKGFQGLDRYFFLPAPIGINWDHSTIKGGEGVTVSIVEDQHPLVKVLEVYRTELLYRSYLNENAPNIAGKVKIIARSSGAAVLAAEFNVLNGKVIFLPTPVPSLSQTTSQRESEAFVIAFPELFKRMDTPPPNWIQEIDIPELDTLETEEGLRKTELERIKESLAEATSLADSKRSLRNILWTNGDHALKFAVIECAEILGFSISETPKNELILSSNTKELYTVAEGSIEAIDMSPHYRLRAQIDKVIEKENQSPRGLIIANGQRLTRPEERQNEISEPLRIAAESVGYAVVTAQEFFNATIAALKGLAPEILEEIHEKLLSTDGIVNLTEIYSKTEQ